MFNIVMKKMMENLESFMKEEKRGLEYLYKMTLNFDTSS